MEAHARLKAMHGDIKVAQQRHGSKRETIIKIEERPQLVPMSDTTWMECTLKKDKFSYDCRYDFPLAIHCHDRNYN
jgi:hypothetical protein